MIAFAILVRFLCNLCDADVRGKVNEINFIYIDLSDTDVLNDQCSGIRRESHKNVRQFSTISFECLFADYVYDYANKEIKT